MAWSFCPWTPKRPIVGLLITRIIARGQLRPSVTILYGTLFICLRNQPRCCERNRLFGTFCCCLLFTYSSDKPLHASEYLTLEFCIWGIMSLFLEMFLLFSCSVENVRKPKFIFVKFLLLSSSQICLYVV